MQKLLTRKLVKSGRITPLQVILLVIAVAIGYRIVIFFAESLSRPAASEAAALELPFRG
jgi:uncharacterized membrane protein YwzB